MKYEYGAETMVVYFNKNLYTISSEILSSFLPNDDSVKETDIFFEVILKCKNKNEGLRKALKISNCLLSYMKDKSSETLLGTSLK